MEKQILLKEEYLKINFTLEIQEPKSIEVFNLINFHLIKGSKYLRSQEYLNT